MNILHKAQAGLESLEEGIKNALGKGEEKHSHTHLGTHCDHLHTGTENRFHSFAPQRAENEAKWFVDGCGYMWAVSVALEEAKESIWILDWWLSPELYLRRPPSVNHQYRLDRMLFAAADRGVKVNIIVYKEVASVLTLSSEHTKKALEVPEHPNIKVFRHPEHVVDGDILESAVLSDLKKLSLKDFDLSQLPEDALKKLYGLDNDAILYWAHHEKLCLIDGKIAFMGGLDLCFGRWDTNQHPIADAHPMDIHAVLFPGQDYNNARVYDFEDVKDYNQNKLDRTVSSRMGWSDLSLCIRGPMVEDLCAHFVQRWNFIYNEKYAADEKYQALSLTEAQVPDGYYTLDGKNVNTAKGGSDPSRHSLLHMPLRGNTKGKVHTDPTPSADKNSSGISVQLVRSCTEWSNGVPTEHSVANAYIQVIHDSQHFVYIENQFFITATSDEQHPVKNKVGAAIVERIFRAHNAGETYKVIVCIPSVPGFAGDLHAEESLGTRAIMEYQYNSICRGDHSIIGALKKAGVAEPEKYIRFYNLRNYDRIKADETMSKVEKASGVTYGDAAKEHDDIVGAGYAGEGFGTGAVSGQPNANLDGYQEAASQILSRDGTKYDSVSACYMEGGPSLEDIPWFGTEEDEINAFVSEELYIHTKLLIADDRVVILGSANMNDRSQLGTHDSEIAVVVEDHTTVPSKMNGHDYQAAKFAASLRRQLFRKHLGLLPPQDWTKPTPNFLPIDKGPNQYDWGSSSDDLVQDPLSPAFNSLWNGTAKMNTEVFAKAFHCVPDDRVRNWDQYEEFFSSRFVTPDKEGKYTNPPPEGKYQYGHVVAAEFPGGAAELKAWLGKVRGTLVEMPLHFMEDVDFASGIALNALTEPIYT